MRFKKIVSSLLACALVATTVFTGNAATAEAAGEEGHKLAVDYDFSKSEGGKIIDKSGNQNDAVIQGEDGNVSFDAQSGTMELKNAKAWVEFPTSIMDNLDDSEKFTIETKYSRSASTGEHSWLFCFGSNPQGTGLNYLFYCPKFENGPVRAGIKNGSTAAGSEKLFETSRTLADDKFVTVDLVFDSGKIKLYIDGVLVQDKAGKDSLDSGYSIVNDVIKDGCKDDVLGYIGKSCWSADTNFNGKISTFKIYDGVLSDAEIQAPYQAQFQAEFDNALKLESMLGKNESKDSVKYDLNLVKNYGDLPVTWTSDKPETITEEGKVGDVASDTTVALTAKTKSGTLEAEKTFTVTVKPSDRSALDVAIARLNDAINGGYCTEASKNDLQKVAESAAAAKGQTEIDEAVSDINKALARIEFPAEYLDPFGALGDAFNPVPASLDLLPKQAKSVKVKDVPANIKNAVNITYKSGDTDVAEVDANGNVTGKNVGYAMVTTRIEAKYDGFVQEYVTLVKVDVDLGSVKASAKEGTLAKGGTTTIDLALPGGVDAKDVTVTYRATGAVSVKAGKVTAKSAGNGKVYVKVAMGGKSITRTVVVKVGDIIGANTLKVKKSTKLKVSGISGKVKWSLDKKGKKLAKISSSGKLTAKKKAGKVKVTAKVGKITMTKTIKIKK